jgi:hypothetical protein
LCVFPRAIDVGHAGLTAAAVRVIFSGESAICGAHFGQVVAVIDAENVAPIAVLRVRQRGKSGERAIQNDGAAMPFDRAKRFKRRRYRRQIVGDVPIPIDCHHASLAVAGFPIQPSRLDLPVLARRSFEKTCSMCDFTVRTFDGKLQADLPVREADRSQVEQLALAPSVSVIDVTGPRRR